MEAAIARLWGWREHIIVPNVSWGMSLNHECDLLIVRKSHEAVEVEIKTSISDLKADLLKPHRHKSMMIKELWFAVPEYIFAKAFDIIPEHAGIIAVRKRGDGWCIATRERSPKRKKPNEYRKLTDKEVINLGRLGCMRIWSQAANKRFKA